MFRIHSRFDEGAFCEWHECQGCEPRFGVDGREAALDWLRGFLVDDTQVATLRAAAHQTGILTDLAGQTSQQVADRLAWLIGSGRLRVCARDARIDESAVQEIQGGTDTRPKSGFEPILPVRSPGHGRAAPPPPAVDDGTFSDIDAAAMMQALLAAAADGSPFCEVCDKSGRPAGETV